MDATHSPHLLINTFQWGKKNHSFGHVFIFISQPTAYTSCIQMKWNWCIQNYYNGTVSTLITELKRPHSSASEDWMFENQFTILPWCTAIVGIFSFAFDLLRFMSLSLRDTHHHSTIAFILSYHFIILIRHVVNVMLYAFLSCYTLQMTSINLNVCMRVCFRDDKNFFLIHVTIKINIVSCKWMLVGWIKFPRKQVHLHLKFSRFFGNKSCLQIIMWAETRVFFKFPANFLIWIGF